MKMAQMRMPQERELQPHARLSLPVYLQGRRRCSVGGHAVWSWVLQDGEHEDEDAADEDAPYW